VLSLLTTAKTVVIVYNMTARRLLKVRQPRGDDAFVEIVVWQLDAPLPGSRHPFKYRLAYVVRGECVVRYDNESGKGDHKHVGTQETACHFSDIDTLLDDFWRDVDLWSG
jgi:hypothetical protein